MCHSGQFTHCRHVWHELVLGVFHAANRLEIENCCTSLVVRSLLVGDSGSMADVINVFVDGSITCTSMETRTKQQQQQQQQQRQQGQQQ